MSADVTTEFLEPENAAKAEAAMSQKPLCGVTAWIRWWSDSSIQLDGDFTLDQLKALAALMEWRDSADLVITIEGEALSGKSILAERLACLLSDEGNTVRVIDGEDGKRVGRNERFQRPRTIEIRTHSIPSH